MVWTVPPILTPQPSWKALDSKTVAYLKNRRRLELVVVILLAPCWLAACVLFGLLVWLALGLPILIRQPRRGIHGRSFTMYKLRTLNNPAWRTAEELVSPNDPRVTRVGAILRRHHLDELPQLWNVLRGEMSLIGPRPEPAWLSDRYEQQIPRYVERRQILPGLTGLAQVHRGYTVDLQGEMQKLEYDLEYISRVSVQTDVEVLVLTTRILLTGAHSSRVGASGDKYG